MAENDDRESLGQMVRRTAWPWGVGFVVLAILVGLLVGALIDRAQAAPSSSATASARVVPSCGESCSSSTVKSKRQGVKRFKRGRVDRQKANVHYKPGVKKKIKRKLHRAYKAADAAGRVPSNARATVTKAYLWRRFTATDSCGYRAMSGSPSLAQWTCDTPAPKINNQLSKNEITGLVCWSAAGLAVPSIVLSGGTATTFWGLVGVGAGASACSWGGMLREYGHD